MLTAGRQFRDRAWAVEERAGIGRHIAQRLGADGETVLDVPTKLSARVRVFDTGQGRKTDPVDAHSVAVAGSRSLGLRSGHGRRRHRRATTGGRPPRRTRPCPHGGCQPHPGSAARTGPPAEPRKFLAKGQASYLLRTAPEPIGIAAQTRHQLARELIEDLTVIDAKIRAAGKQLGQLLAATGSSVRELNGIGPSGAAPPVGRHR